VDLQNSFVVPADIETTWKALLDIHRIAPCMPGAVLTASEGDTFEGTVKVKLGPVTMTYGGTARFVETDEANGRAVIDASGKESRGSGTAKALVTTQLVAESPTSTRVEVVTDLVVTGKPAQFGRGVMQDVAGRIIDQFAANLSAVIAAEVNPVTDQPVVVPQAAESIDLLGAAGAPVLKRLIPVAIGVVAVVVLVVIISSRKRTR
jgi:carbon monoxide dehydrogenase subunit G